MVNSKLANYTSDDLFVGLLNINSLKRKIRYVEKTVKKYNLNILAVCETKLGPKISKSDVNIEGYQLQRNDRNQKGGGVALYVSNHIETNLRPDLMVSGVEAIWSEMILPHVSLLVGCCYRPRARNEDDLNQICEMMKLASKEEKPILLMGDFNINWFKNSQMKRKIMSKSGEYGLKQIVARPTRERHRKGKPTATCIDHVYTNVPQLCYHLTSKRNNFTDHNLISFKVIKRHLKSSS